MKQPSYDALGDQKNQFYVKLSRTDDLGHLKIFWFSDTFFFKMWQGRQAFYFMILFVQSIRKVGILLYVKCNVEKSCYMYMYIEDVATKHYNN